MGPGNELICSRPPLTPRNRIRLPDGANRVAPACGPHTSWATCLGGVSDRALVAGLLRRWANQVSVSGRGASMPSVQPRLLSERRVLSSV